MLYRQQPLIYHMLLHHPPASSQPLLSTSITCSLGCSIGACRKIMGAGCGPLGAEVVASCCLHPHRS